MNVPHGDDLFGMAPDEYELCCNAGAERVGAIGTGAIILDGTTRLKVAGGSIGVTPGDEVSERAYAKLVLRVLDRGNAVRGGPLSIDEVSTGDGSGEYCTRFFAVGLRCNPFHQAPLMLTLPPPVVDGSIGR